MATTGTAQIQDILITESSSAQSDNLTHGLPPSWTPSTYGGPSFSSSFRFFPPNYPHSSDCSLSLNIHRFFPVKNISQVILFLKKKNHFFKTLKPPPKTVLFPLFSSRFLRSVVCPHILQFLTTDLLLLHQQDGFHQYCFTENVFPRSPVAFSHPSEKCFFPQSSLSSAFQ